MLTTYQKLQADGRIGPMVKNPDGTMSVRPYAEYPKLVKTGQKDAKGRPIKVLCKDQRAELAARATSDIGDPEDPVVAEKNRLAQQVADLQEQVAKMMAERNGPMRIIDTNPPMTVPMPSSEVGPGGHPIQGPDGPASTTGAKPSFPMPGVPQTRPTLVPDVPRTPDLSGGLEALLGTPEKK